jgi:hypothetical protein
MRRRAIEGGAIAEGSAPIVPPDGFDAQALRTIALTPAAQSKKKESKNVRLISDTSESLPSPLESPPPGQPMIARGYAGLFASFAAAARSAIAATSYPKREATLPVTSTISASSRASNFGR